MSVGRMGGGGGGGGGGLIYLYFAFSGINFRDMLHHVCDMTYDENMSRPIRTVNVGAQID